MRAIRANRCGAIGLTNSARAIVGNSVAANPGKGSSAALNPMIAAGDALPSIASRAAIAAPAEWPMITCGVTCSVPSNVATAPAIPAIDRPPTGRPVVKPCPGRSTATTW